MGSAVTPEAQPLRVDVTMDEMEKNVQAADAAAKQAAEDAANEAKRQKEAALQAENPQVRALREALKLSEEARQRMEGQLRAPGAVQQPIVEQKAKDLTEEELAELFEKKPLEAVRYLQAKAVQTVEENLSRRLSPLASSAQMSAEDLARRKYPDEFKLFDKEIRDYVDNHPNKAVFGDAKVWDDLISWMRGRPGNIDKLFEYKTEQKRSTDSAAAQAAQAASAGAHVSSSVRTPAPQGGRAFDDTEKAIIKELTASGILDENDPEGDYRKWMRGA